MLAFAVAGCYVVLLCGRSWRVGNWHAEWDVKTCQLVDAGRQDLHEAVSTRWTDLWPSIWYAQQKYMLT